MRTESGGTGINTKSSKHRQKSRDVAFQTWNAASTKQKSEGTEAFPVTEEQTRVMKFEKESIFSSCVKHVELIIKLMLSILGGTIARLKSRVKPDPFLLKPTNPFYPEITA